MNIKPLLGNLFMDDKMNLLEKRFMLTQWMYSALGDWWIYVINSWIDA